MGRYYKVRYFTFMACFVWFCLFLNLSSCSNDEKEISDGDSDLDHDYLEEEAVIDGDVDSTDEDGEGEYDKIEEDSDPPFDIANVVFPFCDIDTELVNSTWDNMTLDERIGQHFLVGADRNENSVSSKTVTLLKQYKVGSVFVGPPNGVVINEPLKTASFVHKVKKLGFETTGVPIFVSLDQEGGPNAVINSITGGTDTIGAMPIGAIGDSWVAFEQFDIMAREIRALGFNMNFGPVLDTMLSTKNGNLNTRSMSPDPDLNSRLGVAAIAGMQKNLVLPTAKHFPGDGLLDGNTHQEFIIVEDDRDVLEEIIIKPFRAAISAGVDGIMTIPQAYSALDPKRSAITSRAINTDLLRRDIGFEGVIMTDSLGMAGAKIGLEEGEDPGMEALKAGSDFLLYASIDLDKIESMFVLIKEELASGDYSEQEFEVSTKRILAYKQKYCLYDNPDSPDPEEPEDILAGLAQPDDIELSASHAERAVVELKNNGVLPLNKNQKILYIGPGELFQDAGSGWLNIVDQTFGQAMMSAGGTVEEITYSLLPFPTQILEAFKAKEGKYDVLVLGTLQGRFSLEQQQVVEWILNEAKTPVVHVCLGVPFDYYQTKHRVDAAVALSGSRSVMVEAGARFIFGQIPALGVMRFDMEGDLDGDIEDIPDGDADSSGNRCVDNSIDCSGWGKCVDTGATYGCVCYQNYHPASDGLDCVADGSDR